MIRPILMSVALIFSALAAVNAQQWSIHLNVSEYYPLYAQEKGYYPILWYSSDEGRGVLFGGFGGGVSWSKLLSERWSLKAQANLLRSRYYDAPVLLTDEQGQSLGARTGITTNLNANVLCIPTYRIAERWQIGAGLGLHSTLLSKTDYGKIVFQGERKRMKFDNKSVRPAVLTLPVELAYILGRFSLSCRVELALTKASRLPDASDERFINNFIELGYRFEKRVRTITPAF